MKKKGLSQNRLAKSAQISQSGLSSIISGDVSPKETTIKAIAEVLECPAWELLEDFPQDNLPKSETHRMSKEATIISSAVDKMPPDKREVALNMLKAVYSEYFEKEEDKIS